MECGALADVPGHSLQPALEHVYPAPCRAEVLLSVPWLARWVGECPPSRWRRSTKKAVWCQVNVPVAFRVLTATENHLPDVLSPHLECLCHWHCSWFSSLDNLDTKFFDAGTLSVRDLLINQHQSDINDPVPAGEWFLKQSVVVAHLVSLNFTRDILLFFSLVA